MEEPAAKPTSLGCNTTSSRIRCKLDRGTLAASRGMTSSGDITKCVESSHEGFFGFSTVCPATLRGTRTLASAGRPM